MVLMQDLTGESLKAGDVGTIVHVPQGGAGYEVEFMTRLCTGFLHGFSVFYIHDFSVRAPGSGFRVEDVE